MGPAKIVRMVATAAAVVFAFWEFEWAGLILAILGLGIGYFVEAERRTLYLVTVVVLATAGVTGALGDIPTLGDYIEKIFNNVSSILNAGALVVIGTGIYEKVME